MSTSLIRLEPLEEVEMAEAAKERANEIVNQLHSLKSSLVSNLLRMGDLLLEVKQNNYHLLAGFPDFQTWLDSSNLDIKISQAYYMMRVVSKAQAVGIERSKLEECKWTSLKEIASLNPETQAQQIKELVEFDKDHTASETTAKVNAIKVAAGQELFALKGFRISQDVLESVVEPAIEKFHLEYGQVIDGETGELQEPSDGKFLEMVCAEYLGG